LFFFFFCFNFLSGNRFQVISAAFSLALATGRILLVDWQFVERELACSWEILLSAPDYPLFLASVPPAEMVYEIPAFFRIGFALEWVHCRNLTLALGDWPVILIDHASGHRHFAPLVLHNQFHAPFFSRHFPNHTFVSTALKFLFRPSELVVGKMQHLQSRVLNGQACDVGFHVRTQYLPNEFSDAISAFRSAVESRNLGGVGFLASDTPEMAAELSSALRPNKVDLRWSTEVVPHQRDQRCEELASALAHLFVLSTCRVVVGTRESSYSGAAAALMQQGSEYVSVCFSRSRCQKIAFTNRSSNRALCFWEWSHVRNFKCRAANWKSLEADCCRDGLCDQCWYHRSEWWLRWLTDLPFWREQDVLTVSFVGSCIFGYLTIVRNVKWLSGLSLCLCVLGVWVIVPLKYITTGRIV
jgi:hypothetical protein